MQPSRQTAPAAEKRPLCITPFTTSARDGSTVHVRQVAPSDRAIITRGYANVSDRSRRLRFLSGHPTLSEAELDVITQSDGLHGLAIGAEVDDDSGRAVPAGIARYVRPDIADEAELAITVTDRFHRSGIGSLLLGALAKHAAASGVIHWRALVSRQNGPAKALFEAMGGVREREGVASVRDDLIFIVPLHTDATRYPDTSVGARMRAVYPLVRLEAC